MDDRILFARRIWLAAVELRQRIPHTLRVVPVRAVLGSGPETMTETIYRDEDRPLVEWCDRVTSAYTRGLTCLASPDPHAEVEAVEWFAEVARLLHDRPGGPPLTLATPKPSTES